MRRTAPSLLRLLPCLAALPGLAAAAEPGPLQRAGAARLTAEKAAACVAVQPFYWELGNASQPLVGGPVGDGAPERRTEMAIASASKWVYAAFAAERRQGQLSAEDVRFLHFQSGYTYYRLCRPDQSVAACQASLLNGRGRQNPATVNRFDYNGGHMQQHAITLGLGSLGPDGLALAVRQTLAPVLGSDWSFRYSQAMPAGGGVTSAADYSRLLRALMTGQLQLGAWLGKAAVCTNPQVCPGEAVKTPVPETEAWHYSIGHWVEDDPQVGDGAFSSAGAFGFYPWISADKRFYGLIARDQRQAPVTDDAGAKPGAASVACGRLIRAAWMDGEPRR